MIELFREFIRWALPVLGSLSVLIVSTLLARYIWKRLHQPTLDFASPTVYTDEDISTHSIVYNINIVNDSQISAESCRVKVCLQGEYNGIKYRYTDICSWNVDGNSTTIRIAGGEISSAKIFVYNQTTGLVQSPSMNRDTHNGKFKLFSNSLTDRPNNSFEAVHPDVFESMNWEEKTISIITSSGSNTTGELYFNTNENFDVSVRKVD